MGFILDVIVVLFIAAVIFGGLFGIGSGKGSLPLQGFIGIVDWLQSFVHKDKLKCDLTICMEAHYEATKTL